MKYLKFVFITFILFASSAQAHKVEALFSKLTMNERSWSLEVIIDATLAVPELRDDPDAPQPKREWLLKQSEKSYEKMRAEAESYLGKALRFSYGAQSNNDNLPYAVSFPGFDKEPHEFPVVADGGAYFSVVLSGDLGTGTTGEFRVHLAADTFPMLMIDDSSNVASTGEGLRMLRAGYSELVFTDLESQSEGGIVTKRESGGGMIAAVLLGFRHVIPEGLDHILFILALFLLQRKWRPLLQQSIVFTIAHSIALAVSMAGLLDGVAVYIGGWIEPLIALSIFYLAVENLMPQKLSSEGGNKRLSLRLSVVFVFGLIHGVGFASSLGALLRQTENWVKPLILGNIGIELAQIVVLGVAWILTSFFATSDKYSLFAKAVSVVIACIALWMFITRVFG